MATLTVQDWGVDGSAVTRGVADAAGDTFFWSEGVVVMLENVGGVSRNVTFVGKRPSSHGQTHDLVVAVPAGTVLGPVGHFQRERFDSVMELQYSVAADIRVGVATMGNQRGVGVDNETPPAMGASPGTIPVLDQSASISDSDFVAALADGMRMANGEEVELWVKNAGVAARTVWLRAANPSNQGFFEDEFFTVDPGDIRITQRIPRDRFGASVEVTYDAVTGLTLLGVRQGRFTG